MGNLQNVPSYFPSFVFICIDKYGNAPVLLHACVFVIMIM